MGVVHVGVAGWDYADWSGIVYPLATPRGFDRLAYLAKYVDVVEVNRSFYGPVVPRVADSWVRRVGDRPEFRFTAKAHRSWTHEPLGDPADVVPRTLEGLAPLRTAGRLGALLVQFPPSFVRAAASFDRLDRLISHCPTWPLVAEFRHTSWDDESAAEWLRQRGVGWCVVDQPSVGRSTASGRPRATSTIGYFRQHGRNATAWFRPDAGRDARYDYLYALEELVPIAEAVRRIAQETANAYVVQNNHFRGKAFVNAIQLKRLLSGVRPRAPRELVAAYPDLAGVTTPDPGPGRLF